MNRSRKKIRSWDDIVAYLMDIDSRYMVRRYTKSPFLSIRDKQTKKQYSLKPIKAFDIDLVMKVARLIDHVGNQEWNLDIPIINQLEYVFCSTKLFR